MYLIEQQGFCFVGVFFLTIISTFFFLERSYFTKTDQILSEKSKAAFIQMQEFINILVGACTIQLQDNFIINAQLGHSCSR